MAFEIKLREVQAELEQQAMDGWLLYDYQRSNPLAHAFLEIASDKMVTRRFLYWIPQKGDPIKIVPLIEPHTLDHLPGLKRTYKGWQEFERLLFAVVKGNLKIAMEYSPCNALPPISKVDAGTVELIRQAGAQVVSSAELLQRYTSIWTSDQLQSHLIAAQVLENVGERTWDFIVRSLQRGFPLDEYKVQQFMLQAIRGAGCDTADWPICAVNAHAADPHYTPTPEQAFPIRSGDLILMDLWCKQCIPHAVYADITRVGVVANQPTQRQREVFEIVKNARHCATAFIQENYANHQMLQGWQVDQTCRAFIQKAGFGDYFIHRTGHNLGEDVHGPGANLDDFETHDYRQLLLGTAFSIEPGIYLPGEFGVRLEYNVYLDFKGSVRITGGIQETLLYQSEFQN